MGHYVLSVVAFGNGPSRVDRGPNLAASYFEWTLLENRPDLSDGGLHLRLIDNGPLRFVPPQDFSACTAVPLGHARDDSDSDTRKIIMRLYVNWRHASANQRKRVLVHSEGGKSHLVNFAERVLEHCEVRRASDKAQRVPIAGTSTAPMFSEEVQADLLFRVILLPCMPWIFFPSIRYFSQYSAKTHRRFGMPSAVVG